MYVRRLLLHFTLVSLNEDGNPTKLTEVVVKVGFSLACPVTPFHMYVRRVIGYIVFTMNKYLIHM